MKARIPFWIVLASLVICLARQATASGPTTYVVQSGDTLVSISAAHGVTARELAARNGLELDAFIYPGQVLVIPRAGDGEAGVVDSEYDNDPLVPNPIPLLAIVSVERPDEVLPVTYAQVIRPGAAVYYFAGGASYTLPPKRTLDGYTWVSLEQEGTVSWMGRDYYEINPYEYVLAGALRFSTASSFRGIALASTPPRPFAWVLETALPRLTPGGELNPVAPAHGRYQIVQVFASERVGDRLWHLIGPNQWVDEAHLGVVSPSLPPTGLPPGAAWIDVDRYQQTLAAYHGDQMTYATVVSTGLSGLETPAGLYQVWHRSAAGKMSGYEETAASYYLEDVPWSLYFFQSYALHGAYWHNAFGFQQSHGCVNLAPLDALWLYQWAPQDVWVWVH